VAQGEGGERKASRVRLEAREVAAIKAAAKQVFGADATVRLFGSRVDDARRGGDIDLHIETTEPVDIWHVKDDFLERLFERIDEQRVDVIVTTRGMPPRPIEAIAYRDGIVL
jgi:predicted nucleotidyltransferase